MSPVAARCYRALFAALLWHRGVAHEALTAAVFLRYQSDAEKPSHPGGGSGSGGRTTSMRRSKSALEGTGAATATREASADDEALDGEADGLPTSLRHLRRIWAAAVSSLERRIAELVPSGGGSGASEQPSPPGTLFGMRRLGRKAASSGGGRKSSRSSRRRNDSNASDSGAEPSVGLLLTAGAPADAVLAAQSLVLENALFLLEVESAFAPPAPHWPLHHPPGGSSASHSHAAATAAPAASNSSSVMSASGCSNETLTPSSPLAEFSAGPFPIQPSQFLARCCPGADSWFSEDAAQLLRLSSRHVTSAALTSSPSEGEGPPPSAPLRFQRSQSEVDSAGGIVAGGSVSSARAAAFAGGGAGSAPGDEGLDLPASAALRALARSLPAGLDEAEFCTRTSACSDLRAAMAAAARQASLRRHGLQALNWLLRSVASPQAVHDLVWTFVLALQRPPGTALAPAGSGSRLSPGSSDGSAAISPEAVSGGQGGTGPVMRSGEAPLEHPVSGTLEMANAESCRQVSTRLKGSERKPVPHSLVSREDNTSSSVVNK